MSSIVCDVLRPLWTPTMHNIAGPLHKGLGGWICDEEYLINVPIVGDQIELSFPNATKLVEALAYDCTRMAGAAFETQMQAEPTGKPPKAISWKIIQSYYSGFFAAHSLMRIFGESCTQFEAEQVTSLKRIASACGGTSTGAITRGFYRCRLSYPQKQLICRKAGLGNAGVHEAFWTEFCAFVDDLSNKVLTGGPRRQVQLIHAKLLDLKSCLCHAHCNRGSWLSWIRNEINYRHKCGAWFPYGPGKHRHEVIKRNQRLWTRDPLDIPLSISQKTEIEDFHSVCQFLVGVCRTLAEDMQQRFSSRQGKSFHHYNAMGYLMQHL